ncbi:MAG: alginate lyase family protein [Chthoniobacteraceae bacterium]
MFPFSLSSMVSPALCVGWLAQVVVVAAEPAPGYFGAKPGSLATAKARLAPGDKELTKALKNLVSDADEALREVPPSVTEKKKIPPSGDPHDYMSLAPYFWPDPKSPGGRPYLRHDGKVNPESRDPTANDGQRVKLMGETIETLALAYYFTGKEAYAAHAAQFARVWFLVPATRMNPSFQFAQAVLGKNEGRGTGILEGRYIALAADSLGLLAHSKSWPATDQRALATWLGTYLDWLLTSDAGKDEHDARNNHGSFYDVQTARLALVLGRNDLARRILEEAKQRRIAVQIEPDGKQPLELVRTTSFSYSRFNLEALCELATLGEHVGVDLWRFATADGRSIRCALDYLVPYVDVPAKPWPLEQIKEKHEAEVLPILRQAALAYSAPGYEAVIAKYPDTGSKRFRLLFVK